MRLGLDQQWATKSGVGLGKCTSKSIVTYNS